MADKGKMICIDSATHRSLKKYLKGTTHKMGAWVTKLIEDYLWRHRGKV